MEKIEGEERTDLQVEIRTERAAEPAPAQTISRGSTRRTAGSGMDIELGQLKDFPITFEATG